MEPAVGFVRPVVAEGIVTCGAALDGACMLYCCRERWQSESLRVGPWLWCCLTIELLLCGLAIVIAQLGAISTFRSGDLVLVISVSY